MQKMTTKTAFSLYPRRGKKKSGNFTMRKSRQEKWAYWEIKYKYLQCTTIFPESKGNLESNTKIVSE